MARQVNFFALLGDGEGDEDVSALLERVAAVKAETPPAEKKKKKEKQQQQEQPVKKEESEWGIDDADLTKAKPLVLPDYGDWFQSMGSFSFLFFYRYCIRWVLVILL
jgi:hypothetical protein